MGARTQAEEVIRRLPEGLIFGAEIGVFAGKMSKRLLDRRNLVLYMVDNWKALPRYGVTQEMQDENRAKAREVANGGGWILHMDSVEAAGYVANGALDFVFIDADHSYEGVKRDITAWLPKLKMGGLMSGHDYANPGEPCGMEVKKAVDEWAASYGVQIDLGKDSTWFARLP